jgi:hypothetical protein
MRFIAVLSSPFSTFRRHRSPISGFAENVINFCRTFVFPPCFLAWCINVDGLVSLDSRVGDPLIPYFSSLNWIAWDVRFYSSSHVSLLSMFLFAKGKKLHSWGSSCIFSWAFSALVFQLFAQFHELWYGSYATGNQQCSRGILLFHVCSNSAIDPEVLCVRIVFKMMQF